MKKIVTVTVISAEKYGPNFPRKNMLSDFMPWLNDKLGRIPEEYRKSAMIEFDSELGYEGDHYPSITITYRRPETEEEKEEREKALKEKIVGRFERVKREHDILKKQLEG